MQEALPEPEPEPPPPPVPNVVQQAALKDQAGVLPEDDDWVPPPPPGGKPPEPERVAPPVMDLPEADMAPPPPPRITGFDDEPDLLVRDMDRPPLHPPLDEPLSGEALDEDPDELLNARRARLAEAGVQPRAPKVKKKRSWGWVGWALLLAVVGGIGYGGYEKRIELVAFYPPLAKLYEMVGIPVDAADWIGLELHNLKSSTILEGGQTKIAVSGDVVNVGESDRILPPLRIAMRGANGSDLGALLVKLEQSTINGTERLSFDLRLPAPKDEVVDLEVAFSSQPVP